jgi:hypothetical protein
MKMNNIRVMVFNTTFNNISIISWWPVSLVEETGVPGEKKENFVLKQHQKNFYNDFRQ